MPRFVGKIHLDQHVPRKDAAFADGLLAAFYFHDFFRRHQNAAERCLQPGPLNSFNQRLVHAFFHSGINMDDIPRSEEHTSELQSLMRISYAVFCLKKKNTQSTNISNEDYMYKTNITSRALNSVTIATIN